jgi:hypothetical protein
MDDLLHPYRKYSCSFLHTVRSLLDACPLPYLYPHQVALIVQLAILFPEHAGRWSVEEEEEEEEGKMIYLEWWHFQEGKAITRGVFDQEQCYVLNK